MEQTLALKTSSLSKRSNLLYRSSEKEQICYACSGNSFVIRSNGRINKCTVALYNDANDIGYITEIGDINVDNKKFSKWIAPLFSSDSNALKCPYVHTIK